MLSASSPDDEALVLGAKYFGFEFVNRIDGSAVIKTWDVSVTPPPLPPIATATNVSPKTPPQDNKPNLSNRALTRGSPLRSAVWATIWAVKSPRTSRTSAKSLRKGTGDECKREKTGAVTQVSYEVRRWDFADVFLFEGF